MKIIQNARDLWRKICCPKCRSVLEIEDSDVRVRDHWDGEDGVTVLVASVECVVCSAIIDFISAPEGVKRTASRRPRQQP